MTSVHSLFAVAVGYLGFV